MDDLHDRSVERTMSWGERYRFSVMDRFGMWLSRRQIERQVNGFRGKRVGDIGCGFDAVFVRSVLEEVQAATVVDLSLAAELKAHPKIDAVEGHLPDVLARIPSQSLDVIVCNNVLEHLWEPIRAIAEIRRALAPGGVCFLNVPSWRGKVVLETAAFRLGITSAEEIDDHKAYYEPRELWQLVVKGGFKPSQVTCRTHKFGLNTYAVGRIR
jgi:SAM-dependent methyltransferase